MTWDFSTDPAFESKLQWMREFVREEIYPLETLPLTWHSFRRMIEPLKEQVKAQGLWAAHLGPELGGQGYGQVKLGLMHEILGGSELAPPAFGNQAPDSGNSELVALAGTEEQKQRWLTPLLAGDIYSAISMTESGTGSDPRQFTTRAVRDGSDWILHGTKFMVGNANRSDVHFVMARTDLDPEANPYSAMSMFIVPTDLPGVSSRFLGTMSDPEARGVVHTHGEVTYADVRLPAESLLGAEGAAFTLAQQRLGPGRIHHCMRWLGVCRRAFDAMCERAVSKSLRGGLLSEKQTIQNWVADSAAAMEAARLLTLKTAWKVDTEGVAAARTEIAMIKYFGATVMHDVLDRAIQIHGALGFSTDLPLEEMYRWSRAARIYDGPDEVHRMVVARNVLRGYTPRPVPTEHVPTRRVKAMERFASRLAELPPDAGR
ncbi:acyl-CoA dehydrogenase family protein [Nocardioides acrostichi]|uniref:Acyl-CoA dehydrogenase family protein n=1 Tax=Nocardioides acrostichi TaxID=2784339 RepID=A0A930UYX3_9ACTN|nr:acyl-CoA dehydrogenase family protein [Nocardioides acrostichi]MBF4160801.1 acyl-CoA dehydrogenase family protein [Nocardioides acrostichi]